MTAIRDKKVLHDYVSPADRLRRSAGMGLGEPERQSSVFWLALILLLILLSAYAAPDLLAWVRGEAPVTVGMAK